MVSMGWQGGGTTERRALFALPPLPCQMALPICTCMPRTASTSTRGSNSPVMAKNYELPRLSQFDMALELRQLQLQQQQHQPTRGQLVGRAQGRLHHAPRGTKKLRCAYTDVQTGLVNCAWVHAKGIPCKEHCSQRPPNTSVTCALAQGVVKLALGQAGQWNALMPRVAENEIVRHKV